MNLQVRYNDGTNTAAIIILSFVFLQCDSSFTMGEQAVTPRC
jgi:hypothetical protein